MLEWKIKGYLTKEGQNIVELWCNSVDDVVWFAFANNLDYLCGQSPDKWVRPWVGTLSGGKRTRKSGCAGLVEIRFEVNNVQYRPLGYYSGEMEFTILFFATEVGGKFEPLAACAIAKTRRAEIDKDRTRAREFVIQENISEETSEQ